MKSPNIQSYTSNNYDSNYRQHCLELYKIYVQSSENISKRRQSANSFFLSLQTAIITIVGLINFENSNINVSMFYPIIGVSGIGLCFFWSRLITSYKALNSAKFKIIHEMETYLPLCPYYAEWKILDHSNNPKTYLPFTVIEKYIPGIFIIIYLGLLIFGVLNIIL